MRQIAVFSLILVSAVFAGACDKGTPLAAVAEAKAEPAAGENAAFDQNVTTPEALIQKFYGNSRILALETANHGTSKRYELLQSLLGQLQNDHHRHHVILERYHDNGPLYQALSQQPLASLDLSKYFQDKTQQATRWAAYQYPNRPRIVRRGDLDP